MKNKKCLNQINHYHIIFFIKSETEISGVKIKQKLLLLLFENDSLSYFPI